MPDPQTPSILAQLLRGTAPPLPTGPDPDRAALVQALLGGASDGSAPNLTAPTPGANPFAALGASAQPPFAAPSPHADLVAALLRSSGPTALQTPAIEDDARPPSIQGDNEQNEKGGAPSVYDAAEDALSPPERVARNERALTDPRVRAFLDTIANAEGGQYNFTHGGGTFSDFSKYPYASAPPHVATPAGRYQIEKIPWSEASAATGLTDFAPHTQDLLAVELLRRHQALDRLQANDLDGALDGASYIWAALPRSSGVGRYAQHCMPLDQVKQTYGTALSNYQSTRRR
jgi:muramidase (phage lysozyme)